MARLRRTVRVFVHVPHGLMSQKILLSLRRD
jgi:hypothetical protein